MLNISRRNGERLIVTTPDGVRVVVLLSDARRGRAKVGIEAPKDYRIDREEVVMRREHEEKARRDAIGKR